MSLLRHLQRFIGLSDTYDYGTVSRRCIEHHERHLSTRGVDLPRWRSPKEIAQMRRLERRAALRIVGSKGA